MDVLTHFYDDFSGPEAPLCPGLPRFVDSQLPPGGQWIPEAAPLGSAKWGTGGWLL